MISYFLKYIFYYISIISDFFCKNKLFILLKVTLYKKLCKNVITRGHIFVFYRKNSTAVTKFYLALKVDGILEYLSSLVFCDEVVLGEHILSSCKTRFLKLIFHMLFSYEVPHVLLEEFYIHSRHAINDCI